MQKTGWEIAYRWDSIFISIDNRIYQGSLLFCNILTHQYLAGNWNLIRLDINMSERQLQLFLQQAIKLRIAWFVMYDAARQTKQWPVR